MHEAALGVVAERARDLAGLGLGLLLGLGLRAFFRGLARYRVRVRARAIWLGLYRAIMHSIEIRLGLARAEPRARGGLASS